jgi:UDP-N-acetylglucosamine acyltransferase
VIGKGVKLGKNVTIGAYTVIEEGVEILNDNKIGSGVQIKKGTKLGRKNTLYEYVSIGGEPQDVKYNSGNLEVKIGNNNILREFVTIHGGSGGSTFIGDNNFLMAYVHIAHNCKLGNNIIIANATQISGHVEIEDYAFISGLCPIHQFVRIGTYSMIAGGYRVPKDVVPYALAAGDPLKIHGVNIIGLKRNGFKAEVISQLKQAYKILFNCNFNTNQAIKRIKDTLPPIPEITHLISFIENSKRGITK